MFLLPTFYFLWTKKRTHRQTESERKTSKVKLKTTPVIKQQFIWIAQLGRMFFFCFRKHRRASVFVAAAATAVASLCLQCFSLFWVLGKFSFTHFVSSYLCLSLPLFFPRFYAQLTSEHTHTHKYKHRMFGYCNCMKTWKKWKLLRLWI